MAYANVATFDNSTPFALCYATDGGNGYTHIHVAFQRLTDRWVKEAGAYVTTFGRLEVSGQLDRQSSKFYGWEEPTYESAMGLKLREAEIIAKNMRKIQRKLDAMDKELGWCPNLPEFVRRVTVATGITDFRINMALPGTDEYRQGQSLDRIMTFRRIDPKREGSVLVDHVAALEHNMAQRFGKLAEVIHD